MTPTAEFDAPPTQGLVLFEVYESTGRLLIVTSSLADVERLPTDVVVKRPWATTSPATRATPPEGGRDV